MRDIPARLDLTAKVGLAVVVCPVWNVGGFGGYGRSQTKAQSHWRRKPTVVREHIAVGRHSQRLEVRIEGEDRYASGSLLLRKNIVPATGGWRLILEASEELMC